MTVERKALQPVAGVHLSGPPRYQARLCSAGLPCQSKPGFGQTPRTVVENVACFLDPSALAALRMQFVLAATPDSPSVVALNVLPVLGFASFGSVAGVEAG